LRANLTFPLLPSTELKATGLQLVIFTNAPRLYGLKALDYLGVRELFDDKHIFAVEESMNLTEF